MVHAKNRKEIEVQDALGLLYKWKYFLTVRTSTVGGASRENFYLLKVFSVDKRVNLENTLAAFARTFPACVTYKLVRYYSSFQNYEITPAVSIVEKEEEDRYIWITGNGPQDFVEIN